MQYDIGSGQRLQFRFRVGGGEPKGVAEGVAECNLGLH